MPSHAEHGYFACLSRNAVSPRQYEVEPSVQFAHVSTSGGIPTATCGCSDSISEPTTDLFGCNELRIVVCVAIVLAAGSTGRYVLRAHT